LSSDGCHLDCDGFERERDESITGPVEGKAHTMGVAGRRLSLKTKVPATFLGRTGSWGLGLGVHR
jgi:hypothetical protein